MINKRDVYSSSSGKQSELAWLDGPTPVPLIGGTISDRFKETVKRCPDRTAIQTASYKVSYKQLDELSDALAAAFVDLGVQKSDRIAVSLGHCVEYAVIVYACAKVGAILVPLNPAHKPRQAINSLNHISASCYVVSTEITLPFRQPQSNVELLDQICSPEDEVSLSLAVPSLKHILLIDNSSGRVNVTKYAKLRDYHSTLAMHNGKTFTPINVCHEDDVASIQFTSGTTSSPKAACLTHRNVMNNGFFVGYGMELSENDIICCPPPMYHCFGQVLGLMTAMTHGITLILPAESFNPTAAVKSVIENNVTVLYGVPTMFLAYLDVIAEQSIAPEALASLRTGVIGGSPIPPSLRKQLHEKMNLSGLTSVYGMTEASPIVTQTRNTDPLEKKLRSVGQVMPHMSLRIVDRNNPHHVLHRGEKGEVQMSGYSVMPGYWNAEKQNAETLLVEENRESGDSGSNNHLPTQRVWLRSGDEGLIDEDGYVQITGRIKDIIIRGGENIHPAEIENCLVAYEHVSDASVVGLYDARYGEVIASFVIPKLGVKPVLTDQDKGSAADLRSDKSDNAGSSSLTPSNVRSWVLDRLGKMYVPKYVFWVDSMPLTASGKVMKFRLRQIGNEWLEKGL
ncbi:Acyl-CoA ligase sidI [Exophiala dermatitidis]